ncbi:hypothetical protein EVAR_93599_1 [Eumeta japonica]|uniref:Uncharacterized protein n=1 Tax=Eumeta variegata TaxID=151549 RepID=A0A4C1TQG1_EUMVA|nr:hypothetical protein EVAR_93599_1 [Eumeta japonica]
MSLKLHMIYAHLNQFKDNLGAFSEEQEERFHQDVAEDGAPSPTPIKERGIISEKRELDAGRRARYVVGVRGVQEGREGGALRNSGSD